MVNIQDQVKIGFNRLSSEIRSLSSSVPPQRQISQPKRKLIKYNNNLDSFDGEADDEIEEIVRSEEEEVQEEHVSQEAQEAQKKHVKKMRKELRVNSINTLFLNNLRL